MAARATFALKAGLCIRRARLAIVTPDMRHSRRSQADFPLIDLSEFAQPPLRRLAVGFLVEPGIGVGGRDVRLVAACLAMEVALGVAAGTRWLTAAILGPETLHRGPGFDQRAVDRDVFIREQVLHLRVG